MSGLVLPGTRSVPFVERPSNSRIKGRQDRWRPLCSGVVGLSGRRSHGGSSHKVFASVFVLVLLFAFLGGVVSVGTFTTPTEVLASHFQLFLLYFLNQDLNIFFAAPLVFSPSPGGFSPLFLSSQEKRAREVSCAQARQTTHTHSLWGQYLANRALPYQRTVLLQLRVVQFCVHVL